MKKMILLAAAAAAVCLAACKKPDTPEPTPGPGPGPETKDEVSVSPASVAFESDGGTFRVAVTTNVADYTVSGNPDWLTVAVNGKELSLTAAQNTVNEARSCALTVTAGKATASIAVSQKAGSPYAGFTVCNSARFEYAGTMLYQFLKPSEEDYGGQGYISMSDEEGNRLSIWVYTELFTSEEEVELTPGTYVKGADNYPYALVAKKMTYAPGVVFSFSDEEEEEEEVGGSYFSNVTTEEDIPLTDGTVEVISGDNGALTVKVDMTGTDGKAYKYVFEGQVEIDTEGATYPGNSDRIDVAATVFGAHCYYMGDTYGNGTSSFRLELYSGDEEDPAITCYEFITEAVEFSEDIDLSGEYYTPSEGEEGEEGEEPADPHGAGMLIPGAMVEVIPGFEMPQGTYIMYSFGDYVLADSFASLVLTRQEDGKYTLTSAIMSSAGDMVMFMGADFTGIHDLEISVTDGRYDDED